MDKTAPLSRLFLASYGTVPETIVPLAGAGSNRAYYRLQAGTETCIGVRGTSAEENRAFLYLARHLRSKGLPVPQVCIGGAEDCRAAGLGDDDCELYYLQEDLGDCSLYQVLQQSRTPGGDYPPGTVCLLRRVIALLPRLQYEGARGLDFGRCFPQPSFDRTSVFFDLNYFKYCFLKNTGYEFNELKLEADFRRLVDDVLQESTPTFLYRDFQSRNIMLKNGEPYFIDFQGGRRGPVYYDLASFLWQARPGYGDALREELTDTYLQHLSPYRQADPALFRRRLGLFVLLRLLQVLGAYGFRGWQEHKAQFMLSIPPALRNLRRLLQEGVCRDYPYLEATLGGMCRLPRFSRAPLHAENPSLVVRVFSFSYKKGIPGDETGNGGGYVFDCRSTHNPGRYEAYKKLTGLDGPVIRFLEEDGEILTFLRSVYRLADAHVGRYLERGFSDLMFSFGCTGGQHRSVYCAEHLAEYLNRRYGVEVRLCHREQHKERTLPAQAPYTQKNQTAPLPYTKESADE